MKRLIVNADDWGLTKGVNRGIRDAYGSGIVTSATLMANGQAFEDAVEITRAHSSLGVGVHLNLSQGMPVSSPEIIPSLVDPQGRLYLRPGMLWKGIAMGRVSLSEIETELRAQILRVRGAGISPTHLDGHKHVHVLPGISDVVITLARELGIRRVRCPLEKAPALAGLLFDSHRPSVGTAKQYAVGRAVSFFARVFRKKCARFGITSPTHFFGVTQTGFLDVAEIETLLRRLPYDESELMCHPGYVDPALASAGTRLIEERERELEALTSPRIRRLVDGLGIRLVDYADLGQWNGIGVTAA